MPAVVEQCRFEAWGTYVVLQATAAMRAAEPIARRILEDLGQALSRFRADSDLAEVNRRAGTWVSCSPALVEALDVALRAAEASEGLVDPLLGRPIVELGYDRDFRELAGPRTLRTSGASPGAWRSVRIDAAGPAVRIPPGTSLDLGATAKAWASDVIATTLATELDCSALVSLGGDVRIVGAVEDETTWSVRVAETPDDALTPGRGVVVSLDGGGLATSSTRVRRWRAGGVEVHHLLDPRTGLPVQGTWRTVTATGPTCVAANVATTAALVLQDEAVTWLEARGVDARLVGAGRRVHTTGAWPVEVAQEASCSTC